MLTFPLLPSLQKRTDFCAYLRNLNKEKKINQRNYIPTNTTKMMVYPKELISKCTRLQFQCGS